MKTFLKRYYSSFIYSGLMGAMLGYCASCMHLFIPEGWRLYLLDGVLALQWWFSTVGVFKHTRKLALAEEAAAKEPLPALNYSVTYEYGDTEPKKTKQEKPHGDVTHLSPYRALPSGGFRYLGDAKAAAADDEDR